MRTFATRRTGSTKRRRGQAMVEFALVIPIFLLIFVAVFDLGRAVFAYNTLTNAAREGVRLAIVNQDSASIIARAKSMTAIVELSDPSVDIDFYEVNSDGTLGSSKSPAAVGDVAVVSFETTYWPITPLISNILFANGVTFTATSTLTVEYSCPNATFTAATCPKHWP
jgi:Flp pilus assembly protein TadG